MNLRILSGFLALSLVAGCSAPTAKLPPRYFPMAAPAPAPLVAGPVDGESGRYRQQHWLVPGAAGLLSAALYRPDGPGPFPLILLAPDGPADAAAARRMVDPMKPAALWFAGHGYAALVVVPRAFAAGDGPDAAPRDAARDIETVADDLDAAYGYLRGQSFVDAGRIVLAGAGTGGFAALGLAARQPTGVMAAINFAGRLQPDMAGSTGADLLAAGDDEVDLLGGASAPLKLEPAKPKPAAKVIMPIDDPALAGLLRRYGQATHRPELWLYAVGEGTQAKRMEATFNRAGSAPARLALLPTVGGGAHAIADQPMLWNEAVAKFLDGPRAIRS
ncbi:MAG: peptidase [Rhodospirillales bacterium]|nr:peptidase [Rhodospirillales bacterium]